MVVEVGKTYEMEITDVAYGGYGVGKVEGFVVFVPFVDVGEVVEVKIREKKKNFGQGILQRVLLPSPDRREHRCPYFGRCGGCLLQHINYSRQLWLKRKQVGDIMSRLGGFLRPPVEEILPSPEEFHYRLKAEFHLEKRGDERRVGFKDLHGKEIIAINRCEIVDESINSALVKLKNEWPFSSTKRYTLWAEGEHTPRGEKNSFVERKVKDRVFSVPREGFFQVNKFLLSSLTDLVFDLCHLTGRETVLDGYCGVGLFSLFLAPAARSVVGVELNSQAVACAVKNRQRAGIKNLSFLVGDMVEVVPKLPPFDVVVLDPPRQGCSKEVLQALIAMRPERIVYVSCNPATLTRDLRRLSAGKYHLERVVPVDMFPQTGHIEVVSLLIRGS